MISRTGLHQATGDQELLEQLWAPQFRGCRISNPVFSPERLLFLFPVERVGQCPGGEDSESLAVDSVHAVHHPTGIQFAAETVKGSQQ